MKTTAIKTQEQENIMNKTRIIAIPQCVVIYMLTCLQDNNIKVQYMGIEESGRILMETEYTTQQEKIIKELIADMNECEKSVSLLLSIGCEMMKEAYLKHCTERKANN